MMFGILQFSRRETIGTKGVRFQSLCANIHGSVNTNIKSFGDRWAKVNPENFELIEILGEVGNYATESEVIKRTHGILPCRYPSYHILSDTVPLTNDTIEAFTVDNDHTQDMDDALTVRVNNEVVEVGVHITDVVPFLKNQLSESDRIVMLDWIRSRGSSAYFDKQSLPMFPNHIAHHVLSLVPKERRKTITLWLRIRDDSVESHYWNSETVVNTAKLSYDNFERIKPFEFNILSKLANTNDPHDIVAWTMVKYNVLFAHDFLQNEGLFRIDTGYTTSKQTHQGIQSLYTHATSPIRRFVDVYNQMIYHNECLVDGVHIDELNTQMEKMSKFHKQHAILELSHKTRTHPITVKVHRYDEKTVWVEYDNRRYRVPRHDTFYDGAFTDDISRVELWGILKNGRSTLRIKTVGEQTLVTPVHCVDAHRVCSDDKYTRLSREDIESCMGYPMDKFQMDCLDVINRDNDLFGTAPTGSGKTTVAMMGILKAFHSGKRVVFSSPIKALSNEKYADMKKRLNGRVTLLTGDMKVRCAPQGGDGSPELLIMTAEILRNKLNQPNDPDLLDVIMVVIDECHYINDTERGPVWEETLLLLPKHVHVVALSATLSAPDDFCKWLSKRRHTECVQYHKRHVPLYFGSFVNDTFNAMINTNEIREGKGVASDKFHWRHVSEPNASPTKLVRMLTKNDMCPAIVFSMSRHRCVQMAESFTENLMVSKRPYKPSNTNGFDELTYKACMDDWNNEILNHKRKFQIYVKKYLKPWRSQLEQIPEYELFIEMLYKGVGYHHSGMIPVLKEFVEILFRDKMIVAVFATESLGVGIDMPARSVVFTQLEKPNEPNGFRNLYTHEFMQMAGRAGRRGKDTKGYVVYYPLPSGKGGLAVHEFHTMVLGKPPRAESQLQITPDFVIRNFTRGYDHMKGSLLSHNICKEIDANASMVHDKYYNDKEVILRIGELNENLKGYGFVSLNKKQIKLSKEEMNGHLKTLNIDLESALQLYKQFKHVDSISSYMYNEWFRVVYFLEQCNFILNNELTLVGRTAACMCDGMPLVRARVVTSKAFENLTFKEIVSWLGLFAWSMRDGDGDDNGNETLKPEVSPLQTILTDTQDHVMYFYQKEIANVNYKVNMIHDWMENKSITQIVQYTGISEFGNFVKTILRIASFIEELRVVFLGMEKYDIYNKFENYEEQLFYGIVSNVSIYVM